MTLPLFSYSTTVVCVDDDALFLKTISQLLSEQYSVKSIGSALESSDFFQRYTPLLPNFNFMRGCTEIEKYDMLKHMPVDLNANALKEIRNNDLRNAEITVLVTDYNMPEMNGIELCRKLQSFPMKKVLLTGEADHQQAVAAFNEGIIDGFIRKDSPSIVDDILSQLKKLTREYFVENSMQLLAHLETDYTLPFSDPKFVAFFNDWCIQNRICEHYLIDKLGNLLLIDDQGNESYFVVHTERTLNNFIELHSDDKEAADFIRAVKLREKIPFFGEGVEGWELNLEHWPMCFYSPQILEGAERYYWTVTE